MSEIRKHIVQVLMPDCGAEEIRMSITVRCRADEVKKKVDEILARVLHNSLQVDVPCTPVSSDIDYVMYVE